MSERISLREFARRVDRAPSYVHKLIAAGKIPRGDDGKIPWPEAEEALRFSSMPGYDSQREHGKRQREAAGRPDPPSIQASGGSGGVGSTEAEINLAFSRARASEKVYQAELKKLEFRTRRGELIEKDDVVADAVDTVAELRGLLLSVPPSVAPSCEGKSAREIEALIEDAIVRAMLAFQNSVYGTGG